MDNKGPDTQVHTVVTWSRAITEPEVHPGEKMSKLSDTPTTISSSTRVTQQSASHIPRMAALQRAEWPTRAQPSHHAARLGFDCALASPRGERARKFPAVPRHSTSHRAALRPETASAAVYFSTTRCWLCRPHAEMAGIAHHATTTTTGRDTSVRCATHTLQPPRAPSPEACSRRSDQSILPTKQITAAAIPPSQPRSTGSACALLRKDHGARRSYGTLWSQGDNWEHWENRTRWSVRRCGWQHQMARRGTKQEAVQHRPQPVDAHFGNFGATPTATPRCGTHVLDVENGIAPLWISVRVSGMCVREMREPLEMWTTQRCGSRWVCEMGV